MRDSEREDEPLHGLLFRISARAGVILFVGVLALAGWNGADLTYGLLRGLLALLTVTACGWAAEQVARGGRREWSDVPDPAPVSAPQDDEDDG